MEVPKGTEQGKALPIAVKIRSFGKLGFFFLSLFLSVLFFSLESVMFGFGPSLNAASSPGVFSCSINRMRLQSTESKHREKVGAAVLLILNAGREERHPKRGMKSRTDAETAFHFSSK